MLVCNRGEGAPQEGKEGEASTVKVFKIDRKNHPLTESNIEILQEKSALLKRAQGEKFFYETLPAELGHKVGDKPNKVEEFMNRKCGQKLQTIGNCWWISPKAGVYGMIMIAALEKAEATKTFANDQEREQEFERIFKAGRIVYKAYSEVAKIELMKQYLERGEPEDGVQRDHKLVQKIHDKYRRKEWKYAFGNQEVMDNILSNMQSLAAQENKPFPKLHKREDIDKLFANYRKRYQLNEKFEPIAAA